MSETGSNPRSGAMEVSQLARGRLGALAIAAIVVSAVAPISVLAAGIPVVFAIQGAATPAMFVIAGALFALFAVGYVAMSRHMVNAGGFVAYVNRAFGKRAATAMSVVTLLFYLASIVAFYAISGAVAAMTLGENVSIPLVTFCFLIVVAVLGVFGVSLSARLLVLLLALETVSVVILDIGLAIHGGPEGFSLAGFAPSAVLGAGFGIGLLLAMVCYSGLEATVVFSEEAREPRRTIPRAVYSALVFVVVLYCVSAWLLSVQLGPSASLIAPDQIGSFLFVAAAQAVGDGFATYLSYLVILSFLALFVGFQSLISRYVFALGRAGVLPVALGRTDGRGTPVRASILVTIAIAIVLGAFTFSGADPFTITYAWLVGLGTVGLLSALIVVSAAIIVFFARTRLETNVWSTKVAPALALIGFVLVLVVAFENYTILGGTDDSARWLLVLIPVAGVLGWLIAEIKLRRGESIDFSADLGG